MTWSKYVFALIFSYINLESQLKYVYIVKVAIMIYNFAPENLQVQFQVQVQFIDFWSKHKGLQ